MTELDEVLKHAQLAHFDNELTSFVIIMVTNKNQEPELHMAVSQDDAYIMNGAVDMTKIEMLKMLNGRAEKAGPRK